MSIYIYDASNWSFKKISHDHFGTEACATKVYNKLSVFTTSEGAVRKVCLHLEQNRDFPQIGSDCLKIGTIYRNFS